MAVKIEGDNNTKVRQEISNLRQEFHGASLSVSSQVKKLKTDSQYAWKYDLTAISISFREQSWSSLESSMLSDDNLRKFFFCV
jgi:hypothetical protein